MRGSNCREAILSYVLMEVSGWVLPDVVSVKLGANHYYWPVIGSVIILIYVFFVKNNTL